MLCQESSCSQRLKSLTTEKDSRGSFFFFSSRRRHTRYWRDWSSDVCSSDLLGLVDRADGLEEAAIHLQRAILGLAQRPTIAAGVLEEGDEVGDPDYVHPGTPEIRVLRESREHHEPTIGATHDRHPLVTPLAQPVGCVREVLDRVHPQLYVVEVGIRLAVARRAPDVGEEDRVPVAQEVLGYWLERGPGLALGAAVDVDDDRRVVLAGLVEEGGDLTPIEGRVAYELRSEEGPRGHPRRR